MSAKRSCSGAVEPLLCGFIFVSHGLIVCRRPIHKGSFPKPDDHSWLYKLLIQSPKNPSSKSTNSWLNCSIAAMARFTSTLALALVALVNLTSAHNGGRATVRVRPTDTIQVCTFLSCSPTLRISSDSVLIYQTESSQHSSRWVESDSRRRDILRAVGD